MLLTPTLPEARTPAPYICCLVNRQAVPILHRAFTLRTLVAISITVLCLSFAARCVCANAAIILRFASIFAGFRHLAAGVAGALRGFFASVKFEGKLGKFLTDVVTGLVLSTLEACRPAGGEEAVRDLKDAVGDSDFTIETGVVLVVVGVVDVEGWVVIVGDIVDENLDDWFVVEVIDAGVVEEEVAVGNEGVKERPEVAAGDVVDDVIEAVEEVLDAMLDEEDAETGCEVVDSEALKGALDVEDNDVG
ncbi:MAG: hypothetical protein Q9209_005123 [Squamulea sp. 1 TL-2023]